MKKQIKTTAAAIALTFAFAGTASAAFSKYDLASDIRAVVGGNSTITIYEDDGVVTLTGFYNSRVDQAAVLAVANRAEGVTKVIDLGFPTN